MFGIFFTVLHVRSGNGGPDDERTRHQRAADGAVGRPRRCSPFLDASTRHAASTQAAAVHDMFVTALAASADSYAATEAANTVAAS
jgi:hypothetical protein